MSESEKREWENMDPDERFESELFLRFREKNYIPQKFACLRRVPLYSNFIKERYNRCLDLYLAPRTLKRKFNIDKNVLLPDLPNIAELRPFPTTECLEFNHHEGRVRTIRTDATGYYLASGGDDKKCTWCWASHM